MSREPPAASFSASTMTPTTGRTLDNSAGASFNKLLKARLIDSRGLPKYNVLKQYPPTEILS
jgi:hypothetical protein